MCQDTFTPSGGNITCSPWDIVAEAHLGSRSTLRDRTAFYSINPYWMDLTRTFFLPARVMLIIGLDSATLDHAKSYCPDAFGSKSMMQ
jgi:hypothetical protein